MHSWIMWEFLKIYGPLVPRRHMEVRREIRGPSRRHYRGSCLRNKNNPCTTSVVVVRGTL